jgi:hypothetical protein
VHPVPTKDWDGNGKIDLPTPNNVTMDSYDEFQNWVNSGSPANGVHFVWSSDGPGYGTLLGDSAAQLNSAFNIAPIPEPTN